MRATNMRRLLTGFLAAAMVFTSVPVTPAQAAKKQTTITVTTQAELNAALTKKGVKSIVIKTSQNITLKLPDSDSKAKLVVDAPNAKITNHAKLAGITIKDAKAFTEKSEKGNSIIVTDKKVSLTVAAKAENVSVKAAAKNADISLKVNGELKKLTVDKKADITVKGNTDKTVTIVNNADGSAVDVKVESAKMTLTKPADVKIAEGTNVAKMTVKTDANIEVAKGAVVGKVVVTGKDANVAIKAHGEVAKVDVNSKAEVALTGTTDKKIELNVNAADASVSTAVKTDVNVNANAQITIEKGAEGSAIAKADGVETKVSNSSADKVAIKDAKGNESSIEAGTSVVSNDEGTKETTKDDNKEPEKKPENTTGGGGSSGSSSDPYVSITGIELDTEKSVEVGKTVKLTPVYKPSNATNKMVSWSVDDGSVASVDQNGNVTGKKAGKCTVTVTTDQMGYKASCTINVIKATLTGITLSQTSAEMYVDDTLKLSASAVPAAAELGNLEWTSSATGVATVENGKVTAKGVGSATITCQSESGEIKAACTVTVKTVPEGQTMVKLTFKDKDGDTTLATKTVVSGAALAAVQPTDPTKTGYEFKGWAASENGEAIKEIAYNNTEITLYAKYEPKTYTITFIGADGEVIGTKSAPYDEKVSVPEVKDTESKTFVGWSTAENATTAEVNANDTTITCTGDATYYYIGKWKAYQVAASGDNVKFYCGAWKLDENLDKNLGNSNELIKSLIGYFGYDSTGTEPVSFVVDSGYKITGITVDKKDLNTDELKTAIANCSVEIDRKSNHTIVITTGKIGVTVAAKGSATCTEGKTTSDDGKELTWNYVTVTAPEVKLSEVVTITTSNIDNPIFAYTYDEGDPSNKSGDDFAPLDPENISLNAGTSYRIKVHVMENGNHIDWIYIKLTVNAPNTSDAGLSDQGGTSSGGTTEESSDSSTNE